LNSDKKEEVFVMEEAKIELENQVKIQKISG
jgi:hypothetical protein